MFNFPSNVRLPGFRVGLPEDAPGFNINQDGSAAGSSADAPPADSSPYGNALQSALATNFGQGAAGSQSTGNMLFDPSSPQGVVPVNCTTESGMLNCTTPMGRQLRPVPAPEGFASRIAPDVPRYHSYSTPYGPVDIPAPRLMDGVVDYPTGGPRSLNRPATPQGTVNEATPDQYYTPYWLLRSGGGRFTPFRPYGTPLGRVKSYLTADQDGNRVVMNVTEPGHPLFPGYVARYVTPSGNGSTIQTEGEGLAWPQDPNAFLPQFIQNLLNVDTWRDAGDAVVDQAK